MISNRLHQTAKGFHVTEKVKNLHFFFFKLKCRWNIKGKGIIFQEPSKEYNILRGKEGFKLITIISVHQKICSV